MLHNQQKKQKLFELIDRISLWHNMVFPKKKLTLSMMGRKVYEEAYELLSSINRGLEKQKIEEEVADIFISLIILHPMVVFWLILLNQLGF